MEWVDRIIAGMLRPINPYSTIILGVFTALWGLWLLLPEWTVFTSSAIYSKASEFAPEWAWGSWSLTCGILITVAVLRAAKKALSFAVGFAIWHWWTIAGMFWWGDWHNTAGLTYTFVAIYTTYIWLNFRINFIRMNEHIDGTKF